MVLPVQPDIPIGQSNDNLVQRPAQKDRHEGGLSAALIEAANQATTNAPARRSIYPASRSFTPNKCLVWSQNTGPAGETSKALLKRHNNSRQGCMKMRTKNENPCGFGFWCLRPEAVADRYLIFCRRLTVKSQNKNPPFQ
jgi:hypothetical protein